MENFTWVILQKKWNCNIINYKIKRIMKSLEEFVALFAEQFDETDVSEITSSTAFHDLDEYSSLIALSIIAMVDEEFDVTLKGDDMKSSVTIEDLYNVVKSRV